MRRLLDRLSWEGCEDRRLFWEYLRARQARLALEMEAALAAAKPSHGDVPVAHPRPETPENPHD